MNYKNKKILIIHDRFMFRGGAERLVLDMACGLKADIATGFWDDEQSFPRERVPHKLYVLGKLIEIPGIRYLYLLFLFLFKTDFVKSYDVIIFSGNNCLVTANRVPKGVSKIFYCHSPVRHVYDLKDHYLSNKPWWKREILRMLIFGSKIVYNFNFRKMDLVITNSQNTRGRLLKYLNTDARVIYPPIQTNKFTWRGQKDYYLTVGRVDRLKRISDVVRAFQQMPDKKLIIPSSGDDMENVKQMARGHDNISVVGWVSDDNLQDLVGNCIATFYVPLNEDSGMAQLEGMAAGKPCISVDEGGMKESVIDDITGFMVSSDYGTEDLIEATKRMTSDKAFSMKQDCINMAQKFNYERFVEEMKEVIYDHRN